MITRYVNTASTPGGNGTTNATTGANRAYASAPEAEAAEQTTQTDDYSFFCCGATADTRTTFDGWVPGSFRIYVKGNEDDAAGAHAGVWDTGKYRISAASGTLPTLEIVEDNVTVQRIQLQSTHVDGSAIGRFGVVGLSFVADALILKGPGTTSSSIGAALGDTANTNVRVRNCIAYDWVIGIYVRQQSAGAGDSFIINNTVHSCSQGIRGHDLTDSGLYIQAWNNLAKGNTTDWVESGVAFDQANSGNNAFGNSGTACPGSSDIDLSTYTDVNTFVDAPNDNFHLNSGGTAYSLLDNDGVGPASNSEVSIIDIDGDTRSGTTTSVGADFVSSGTSIAVSDSGSAVDNIGNITVVLAITDSGVGLDAGPAPAVDFTITDSGSAADALLVAVAAAISDAGTVLDALSVSVSVPLADSGVGVDQISLAALLQVIESATGTDVVIRFDASTRIAVVTFSLARRSVAFALATRSMAFALARREIAFQLN